MPTATYARSVDAGMTGMFDDWGRRKSSPPLPLSATAFDSLNSVAAGRSRRTSTLSPPPSTKSPSLKHENLLHRLRSNSGLSLHTNEAALRQYIDYNQDGSARLSQFDPIEWHGDGFLQNAASSVRGGLGHHGNGSATKLALPDFFSREVVQMVLHNPTTAHRLRQFAESKGSAENMAFLQQVWLCRSIRL
jgi:phototropin